MPKRILVVDDERQIVKLVEINLRKAGYDVVCAYDGVEALEKVQNEKPDMIVLDVMMPRMNGYLACRLLKSEPGTRQIRIYTRIPNPDGRLVGGLYAGGRVLFAAKERALGAPLSALRREGSEDVVYRVRGGRAERIPVQTGLVDEEAGRIELIGRLGDGDSLLAGVIPGLRDSIAVRVLASAENGGQGGTDKP